MTNSPVAAADFDEPSIGLGSSGSAVKDVQERLLSLGYGLGQESEQEEFGDLTARAVMAFREAEGLAPGSNVDRPTWAALVNATFTLGDRLLYLRMPYFHGSDVHVLQTALAALGFSCLADGIFGVYTEHAVREFQQNAGISGDGIVGDSTFSAIGRLRHAWEGKNVLRTETLSTGFARAAEVLESRAVRLYGSDELAGNVAERISNLAMATTPASLVDCVRTLSDSPDDQTLTIRLTSESPQPREIDQASGVGISDHGEEDQIPQVVYDSDMTINARVATAVGLATELHPQIIIRICYPSVEEVVQGSLTMREEQHIAITLLDALCLAFSKE